MKTRNLIIAVLCILVAIVGITAYLNMKSVETSKVLEENASIRIMEAGVEKAVISLAEIKALGEVYFAANLKKSGKDPIKYNYTGVPLKKVLEKCGIDLSGKQSITAKAIDGYTVAISMDKVLMEDNVYLTYLKEGKPLGGREEGGDGPLELIISKDQFSQYWCKYAIEVDVQ